MPTKSRRLSNSSNPNHSEVDNLIAEVKVLNDLMLEFEVAITQTVNSRLCKEVAYLQQYSRRSCLIVADLPQPEGHKESTEIVDHKGKEVLTQINCSDLVTEIDKVHRLPRKSKGNLHQRLLSNSRPIILVIGHIIIERICTRTRKMLIPTKQRMSKFNLLLHNKEGNSSLMLMIFMPTMILLTLFTPILIAISKNQSKIVTFFL